MGGKLWCRGGIHNWNVILLPVAPDDERFKDGAQEDQQPKNEQVKKQESREIEVEGDIAKPEFMATKSMVDYAPAEISAVEQYEALVGKIIDFKHLNCLLNR